MNKEKFIKWIKEQQLYYRERWFEFYIDDNKEMSDYAVGKIAMLNEILVFTKRGDFDDNHSN